MKKLILLFSCIIGLYSIFSLFQASTTLVLNDNIAYAQNGAIDPSATGFTNGTTNIEVAPCIGPNPHPPCTCPLPNGGCIWVVAGTTCYNGTIAVCP